MRRLLLVLLASCSSNHPTVAPDGGAGGTLGDDAEAITLDGIQVPKLLGATAVAAFRWDGAAFVEVPIQIDPREVRPFSDALSPDDPRKAIATAVTTSFYTDSNLAPGDGTTYVGVDHDVTLDHDDELVVLAKDFGAKAPDGAAPPNVDATTRTELHASHASDATRNGYLYVFAGTPTAFPPAVTMAVKFTGQSSDFKTFYKTNATSEDGVSRGCGAGAWSPVYPEDTEITTAAYTRHFSGRWLSDEITISGGPDLLDTGEVRPAYSELTGAVAATTALALPNQSHACDRSTTSFSGGPGTFVTLRSGPIRAIRSYFGANSGTITQRTNLFYPAKEDIYTYLRVHPIVGASDGLDLSTDAIGMTYYNEHNTGGLAVDGASDPYDRTLAHWELVTGATQGSLLSVHRQVMVDLGAASTTTYAPQTMFLDQSSGATCVCSGDNEYIAAHGPQIFAPTIGLPNTDPLRGDAGQVFLVRSMYYSPGATTPERAAVHAGDAQSLVVAVDGGASFDPFAVTCGDGVCEANETSANCEMDCAAVPGASRCGDGTCVDGEQFICTKDCPVEEHTTYFTCLATSCQNAYFSCGSDPGCTAGLECIENCTDTYATCVATCSAQMTDQGSIDLANALIKKCGAAPCSAAY